VVATRLDFHTPRFLELAAQLIVLDMSEPGKPIRNGAHIAALNLNSPISRSCSMLDNIGHAYIALGVYDHAESLFRRAYSLHTSTSGSNTEDTASSLAKYQEAEPLFRQSLAIRQKRFGDNNALVEQSMGSLGECLYFESRWNEAELLLRHALTIKHQLHDDSDSGIENFLALVLERKGDYQEAAELLRQAFEISRRTQGTDGPDYVAALHNLAGTLIVAGDLSGSETMERQSLDIRRRILGEWHPEVYYSLNNLGGFCCRRESGKPRSPSCTTT
jgi:tetratricopeptide (TPR) repeat protein